MGGPSLVPPYGVNLLSVIDSNKGIYDFVNMLLSSFNRILYLDRKNKKMILIPLDGLRYPYPYEVLSDTFKRVIFYVSAIESIKDSVTMFEEPETHMFPVFVNFIAEKIATYGISEQYYNNQYFIVTHNPYFLDMLVSQTPGDMINIFKATLKDNQTKVELFSKKEVEEATYNDEDLFFQV